MGKAIRVFFVLLLMCATLFSAPNYMQQLQIYDTQMKGANNDEILRIFHGLKSVYIQSIIKGDDNLKKETLERLIKTAKVLKLDASKYESELSTMNRQVKKATNSPSSSKQSMQKPNVPPPAVEGDFSASDKETAQHIPPQQEAPKSAPTEVVSSSPTPQQNSNAPKTFRGKNVLQSVVSHEDEIVLHFGEKVPEKNIKVFVLRSMDSYKKIIDLPAVILNAPLTIATPKRLQGLRISQYNTETIRIVLDAQTSFETYVSVLENQVIISLDKKPMLTQKRTTPSTNDVKETHISTPQAEPKTPIVAPIVTPPTKSLGSKKVSKSKTIVIDAGHGGKDAGAIGYKQRMEKHFVLDVALQLGKELRSRGYKVFFTRQRDEFINLRDRTKVANDKNADLFISLHANAAPNEAKSLTMKGLETFFLSPDRSERSKNVAALENKSDIEEMNFYSKETFLNVLNREKIVLSNKVAIDIQSNMLKSVRRKYNVEDGGVREAPFWVLVGATMPSVLIELGYISNPEECDNMFNSSYQKLLVEGISNGIDQYYINNS